MRVDARAASAAVIVLLALACPAASLAGQEPAPAPPARPATVPALGIEAFGGAAVTFPAAPDSFEAAGLGSTPVEFGGGARVTGLWQKLFAQVAYSRWSDTGERSFVDSTGAVFPLGIPLSVKTSFVDVSLGWKEELRSAAGRTRLWTYVAAGAGVAQYSEESPFAEPDDDFDTSAVSYHVIVGVEVPILRWLAVGADVRYRYVPDILGEGGVSAALEEDALGGFQTAVGLRIGLARTRPAPPAAPAPPPQARPAQPPPRAAPTPGAIRAAVIAESAPVFLLPDARRVPLRILPPGTTVRILEESGEWVRVEFADPQFGPRYGYVQRKFIQDRQQGAT